MTETPNYKAYMSNWLSLSKYLKNAGETDVKTMVELEFTDKCRPDIIYRLHARMNTLRRDRERTELSNRIAEVLNERQRNLN